MRVIRMEVVARYQTGEYRRGRNPDQHRPLILDDTRALDDEITELVRHRASACLPSDHRVFARTQFEPSAAMAVTDLWIVDPKVRWPFCLLTRSAWKVLAPVLGHIIRDLLAARLQADVLEVSPRSTRITALTPAPAWCDPFLLAVMMVLFTSVCWLRFGDPIKFWLYGWL